MMNAKSAAMRRNLATQLHARKQLHPRVEAQESTNEAEECRSPNKECEKLRKGVSKFYGPRIKLHGELMSSSSLTTKVQTLAV
jgi:hypothetical protein